MNWVSSSQLPRPHVDYMCSINVTWKKHKSQTSIYSKTQSVFTSFAGSTKEVVLGICFLSLIIFRVHVKSASFFCQSTCLVESGRAKISIASFVVVPSAVEIDRAVQSLLKHCPPSTACFLDLKYIECTGIVRIDCINTADSLSSFV